jgi:hypothetical protein
VAKGNGASGISVAYSKELKRRGYATVSAIDPNDGGHWDLLIADSKQDWVASQGMGAAKELAFTVRWSLLNIRALYRGIRDVDRDIDEDAWLCYVANPPHAYDHRSHRQVATWPGEVFTVFATDEREVYGWYWCKCDLGDRHIPHDHSTRFREKVF